MEGYNKDGYDTQMRKPAGVPVLYLQLFINAKLFFYQSAKTFFDFRMAGNRRHATVMRICINIVPVAVAFQVTPFCGEIFDKLSPLQTWITMSFECISAAVKGRFSSEIIIRYASLIFSSSSSRVSPWLNTPGTSLIFPT